MGHTRLGKLPKTRKWNELVERIVGTRLTGDIGTAAFYIDAIAAQTLDASRESLENAARDSGVLYSFYLLTQVAQASRSSNWEDALSQHGINVTSDSSVFDLTAEMQGAIDRYLSRTPSGATDLSEMAQQSVGEALTSLAGSGTIGLFGGSETPLPARRGEIESAATNSRQHWAPAGFTLKIFCSMEVTTHDATTLH